LSSGNRPDGGGNISLERSILGPWPDASGSLGGECLSSSTNDDLSLVVVVVVDDEDEDDNDVTFCLFDFPSVVFDVDTLFRETLEIFTTHHIIAAFNVCNT